MKRIGREYSAWEREGLWVATTLWSLLRRRAGVRGEERLWKALGKRGRVDERAMWQAVDEGKYFTVYRAGQRHLSTH